MKKRMTSLVLALLMVLTLLPVQVWATDTAEEPVDTAPVQEEETVSEEPAQQEEPEQAEEQPEEPMAIADDGDITVVNSGNCGKNGDNVKWVLTSDGTLTISGEGEMEDYNGAAGPWSSWREGEERTYVKTVIVEEGVTSIGDNAFGNSNSEMASVTIPSSVKTIGISAFRGCGELTEVQIPEGVVEIREQAFADCMGLASITLPDSLITIGDGAFFSAWALEKLVIPDGVVRIGKWAFQNCARLAELTLGTSLEEIGESAFQWCALKELKLPDSLKALGDYAFRDAFSWELGGTYLDKVTIPASVVSIGKSVFTTSGFIVDEENNYYMAQDDVLFSKDGKTLVCYPSKKETSNSTYAIPDGVECIASCAFEGDCALLTITIPASVTSIESEALIVTQLRTINVDSNNKSFISVDNVLYSADKKRIIRCTKREEDYTILDGVERIEDYCFYFSNITGITIPDTVTYIGNDAFTGCYIETVEIPDSVEIIGNDAFWSCGGLSNVKLSGGLKTIGERAFYACGLTELTIPEGVERIGKYAFANCGDLEKATIPGSVAVMGESIFWFCEKLTNVEFKDGVQEIGESMFGADSALTTVTIPDTVKTIGICAFMSCDAITDVYYGGTEEEWKQIKLNRNDELTAESVTIHYGEVKPLPLGDLDGDGKTTMIEAQATYEFLIGTRVFSARQKTAVDFTGDGIVDVYDLQYCYEVAVGLIPQPNAQ